MILGDIAIEVKETERNPLDIGIDRLVGLEHLDPEELKISRWGNIADGTTFTKKFKAGQILFGRRRAYQKKAALADFDGICSGDITVIEAIPGKIIPELLPYIIQNDSFFEYAVNGSAGSLSPRVKWIHLAEYEVNLPDAHAQREIAELMIAFDDSIERKKLIKQELTNTRRIYRSENLLDALESDDSNIKMPEGWKLYDINTCANILDSRRIPMNDAERNGIRGAIPYYGSNGIVDYINKYIFDEEIVLISEDCGYFDEYFEKPIAFLVEGRSWVNNHAHVLTAKSEICSNKWLFYSLVHKNIMKFIVGGTRSKLNQADLKRINIPVPSSIGLQESLISKLIMIDNLIDEAQIGIETLMEFKKAKSKEILF